MDVSLNDELVGYWPMDEGSGSVLTRDDSGWGSVGLLTNITDSNWKDGISGKCIDFNGTDEYIDCSNNSALNITNEISISAWIYINTGASDCVIIGKTSTGVFQYMMYYDSGAGNIRGYLENGGVGSSANGSIVTNKWIHVVMVYNKTDVRYYIDDVLSGTPFSKTDSITFTNYNVYIGKYGTGYHFDGKIDEVRIYNRDLNTGEVEYLFTHPSGVNKHFASARLLITDLDGNAHAITDDIEDIEVDNVLSYGSNTFVGILANYNDAYSYVVFGCKIEILMGIGGYNTKKLNGIITEATYTLDDDLIDGRIEISGEDIEYKSHRIYIFNIIENMEISNIVKTILNCIDVTTGKTIRELADIDSDYSYIESTSYTSEITTFAWTPLSAAFKELAEYAGYEWYIDVNKKLHFYEIHNTTISTTITEDDLVGNPRIGIYNEAVNRAVVLGGFWDKIDQTGHTKDSTYLATDTTPRESFFVPTNNLLSVVKVWTSLVPTSNSNLVLTIEDVSSNIISNSLVTAYKNDITDGGYTTFTYKLFVNLVVGETYYVHVAGTTTDGVNIGKGIVASVTKIDYVTKHPVRVGSVSLDESSYDKYGVLMDIHVDADLDDPTLAELKSKSMINGEPQKSAIIPISDDSIGVGNLAIVYLTKPGIQLSKIMKVMRSTLVLKHRYIENTLEFEEL